MAEELATLCFHLVAGGIVWMVTRSLIRMLIRDLSREYVTQRPANDGSGGIVWTTEYGWQRALRRMGVKAD